MQTEREKSAKDLAVIDSSESSSPGNQTPIGVKRKSTGTTQLGTAYKLSVVDANF